MKNKIYPLFFLALTVALVAKAQTVTPSQDFVNCGSGTTTFNGYFSTLRHTIIKPGGKILSGGHGYIDLSRFDFISLFAQYNTNGSPDVSFGINGQAVISLNVRTICESFTLQPDGKIIGVGTDAPDNSGSAHIPLIFRLNSNGTVDSSFNIVGKNALRFDSVSSGSFSKVVVLPDEKILSAGYSTGNANGGTPGVGVMKFKTNGSIDSSFGNIPGFPGRARIPMLYAGNVNMLVQLDGKIILAYSRDVNGKGSPVNLEFIRFLSNGVVDSSFATNGTLAANGINMEGNLSWSVQPDGKFVFAFTSNNEFNPTIPSKIVILRYRTDFTADSSFGVNGKVELDNLDGSGISFYNTNTVLQPDGKILLSGGTTSGYPNNSPMLIRLNADGQLDVGFNNAGYYFMPGVFDGITTLMDIIAIDNNTFIVNSTKNFMLTKLTTNTQIPATPVTYYFDADNDGYGAGAGLSFCSNPGAGYITQGGDCNDSAAAINPGAPEICNFKDDDCDGQVDEGLAFTYYLDADGDGFGSGPGQILCSNPGVGYVTKPGDCDDGDPTILDNCAIQISQSFSSCGSILTTFNGYISTLRHTSVKPGGKILSGGHGYINTSTFDIVSLFAQYNSNGIPDVNFGVNGQAVISLNTRTICESFTLQPDGKIIGVGTDAPDNSSSAHIPLIFRLNENGTVDRSFNVVGKNALRFDSVSSGGFSSVVVLQDDKILAGGISSGNVNGGVSGFGIMKFNVDGTIDTSFGHIQDFRGRTRISRLYVGNVNLLVQNDGKIILAYSRDVTGNGSYVNLEFIRFLSDGVVDSSFGTNGTLAANGINMKGILTWAVQPDGKYVFSLTSNNEINPTIPSKIIVLRYLSGFTADSSFGVNGKVELGNLNGSGISFYNTNIGLQSDGKILLSGGTTSGYPNNSPMLIRLTADGKLDGGFNNTGYYFIPGYITTQSLVDITATDNQTCLVSSADNFRLTSFTTNQQNPTGGALNFDGSDDEVQLGRWFNNEDFSIEMWIKPGISQSPYATIIDNGVWSFNRSGSISDYYFYVPDNISPNGFANVYVQLTPGEWQHIALVKDVTEVKVYKNGILVASKPHTGNIPYSGVPLLRLASSETAGRPWNGAMDEVRFWNRPLTQAEIQYKMNCELAANQNGLSAYYKFNQGFDACNNLGVILLSDSSGNGHNGNLTNFALTGTASNWITGNISGKCSLAQVFSIRDGLWSDPSIWDNNQVPDSTRGINAFHHLEVNVNASCMSIKVVLPGVVQVNTGVKLEIKQ